MENPGDFNDWRAFATSKAIDSLITAHMLGEVNYDQFIAEIDTLHKQIREAQRMRFLVLDDYLRLRSKLIIAKGDQIRENPMGFDTIDALGINNTITDIIRMHNQRKLDEHNYNEKLHELEGRLQAAHTVGKVTRPDYYKISQRISVLTMPDTLENPLPKEDMFVEMEKLVDILEMYSKTHHDKGVAENVEKLEYLLDFILLEDEAREWLDSPIGQRYRYLERSAADKLGRHEYHHNPSHEIQVTATAVNLLNERGECIFSWEPQTSATHYPGGLPYHPTGEEWGLMYKAWDDTEFDRPAAHSKCTSCNPPRFRRRR
jgi:hypothetical protein